METGAFSTSFHYDLATGKDIHDHGLRTFAFSWSDIYIFICYFYVSLASRFWVRTLIRALAIKKQTINWLDIQCDWATWRGPIENHFKQLGTLQAARQHWTWEYAEDSGEGVKKLDGPTEKWAMSRKEVGGVDERGDGAGRTVRLKWRDEVSSGNGADECWLNTILSIKYQSSANFELIIKTGPWGLQRSWGTRDYWKLKHSKLILWTLWLIQFVTARSDAPNADRFRRFNEYCKKQVDSRCQQSFECSSRIAMLSSSVLSNPIRFLSNKPISFHIFSLFNKCPSPLSSLLQYLLSLVMLRDEPT